MIKCCSRDQLWYAIRIATHELSEFWIETTHVPTINLAVPALPRVSPIGRQFGYEPVDSVFQLCVRRWSPYARRPQAAGRIRGKACRAWLYAAGIGRRV